MAWKCEHELKIGQSMQTQVNKKLAKQILLFLLQTLFQSLSGGGLGTMTNLVISDKKLTSKIIEIIWIDTQALLLTNVSVLCTLRFVLIKT